MGPQQRMSPITALFLGMFGVGAIGIASGTSLVLYGMRIIDQKADSVLGVTENIVSTTLNRLPDLLESLPDAAKELLNDRRAPEYMSHIAVDVNFIADERSGGLRPVATIKNNGAEVVSLLALRVAALSGGGVPIREWTEVVATPLPIDDDWRGVLMPGATRYVVLSHGWRSIPVSEAGSLRAAVEISDIRVWKPVEPT